MSVCVCSCVCETGHVFQRLRLDVTNTSLKMNEVQGSEKETGIQLGAGATVFMSACNTARGKITANGVVGLGRGFQMAGAAAVVVSLWSVDDASTAALMEQTYRHLVEGLTVPQALRLAMLHLSRRVEWKRPMHWAGFLVMGASTRLASPSTD